MPDLFAVCLKDTLAPPNMTKTLAKRAPQSTVRKYDCGHFEIYLEPYVDKAIDDYLVILASLQPR